MDRLREKYNQLNQALTSLEKSIACFERFDEMYSQIRDRFDYNEEYRIHRDSVIQRFEYSIDLFWKFINKYLEESNVLVESKFAGDVVRDACIARLISENDAEQLLLMIKSRNKTSHIYVEEIAELLVGQIPAYLKTMQNILLKIGFDK
jgi:nucleotidyltransferase substrate binding protein (TIGR01987 family)